jgi:glutamate 5-kinase
LVQKKFTTSISHFKSIQSKYPIIYQNIGLIRYAIIERNQRSIATGIVQVTATFENGANIEICQKLKSIIGRVKLSAAIVRTKASFIAKVSGIKENTFFQKL